MGLEDSVWLETIAAIGRIGKISPAYAPVGDTQIEYPEGHYELRQYVDRKTVWRNVGSVAALALAEQIRQSKRAIAIEAAADAGYRGGGYAAPDTSPAEVQGVQRASNRAGQDTPLTNVHTAIEEFIPIAGVEYADQLTEGHPPLVQRTEKERELQAHDLQ